MFGYSRRRRSNTRGKSNAVFDALLATLWLEVLLMIMMIKMIIAVTQLILKLGSPDFALN